MTKLKAPGERGGIVELTASPFDLLSLVEGLTSAHIHLTHVLEETDPSSEWFKIWTAKLKDVAANTNEIQSALDQRNAQLEQREAATA